MSTLYNKIITQPENGMTKQAWQIPLRIAARSLPRLLPRLILSAGRTTGRTAGRAAGRTAGRTAAGTARNTLSPDTISDIAFEAINFSPNTNRVIQDMWNGRGTFTSNVGNLFKSMAQDGLNNMPAGSGFGDLLFDKIPHWLSNWNK